MHPDGTADLVFKNYGRVEAAPRDRVRAAPAKAAPLASKRSPTKKKRPPRVRESRYGLEEAEASAERPDDLSNVPLGWLAARGRPRDLEDALRDRSCAESDDHGWTWLHHAAAAGRADNVAVVLKAIRRAARDDDDHGASDGDGDPRDAAEDLRGFSPLHVAVVGRHVDVCKVLLEAGCSSTAKDADGLVPADLVARDGVRARRVRKLLATRGATDDYSSSSSDDDDDGAPPAQARSARRGPPPPDQRYESRPFPAPRYVRGACRLCDAVDPCERRMNRAAATRWIPPTSRRSF